MTNEHATSKPTQSARLWGLVPAAGAGRRMQSELPKQYLDLGGRTVLEHSLHALAPLPLAGIMVALAANDSWFDQLSLNLPVRIMTTEGGAERCHSVDLGLLALLEQGASEMDWVLVHDAARPCVSESDLQKLVAACQVHACGGLLGVPVRDTMKRADACGEVTETVPREGLWHALTPQMFRIGALRQALETALRSGTLVTDEASAMERAGHSPLLVPGEISNIKITRPEDLKLAAFYLGKVK